ncbi:MAG TPA: hypothetical protein VF458_09150 [Ktedonobacteraceae bacterium]
MPDYTVRRVRIGKTAQLDALAHAAGQVYTRTHTRVARSQRREAVRL